MSDKKSNEDFLNKIVYLMQTDKSADAPADSVKWAKNIFRARAFEPKKSLAQKIVAVLQMDLSPSKASFGERSASASQARQMLFGADENSIDLRITKNENGTLNIHGQILGEGFANAFIKLGDFETGTNELSEFKFTDIPAGSYDLEIKTGDSEIVVKALNLE